MAQDRTNCAGGVHRAEDFTGAIVRAPAESIVYESAHALLGQDPSGEMLANGPRYRPHGLVLAEPKIVYSLADAGIAMPDGVVYCPRTRRAVAETVRCWTQPVHQHPLLNAPRFPRARPLAGCTLSLLTLSAEGFYHFLVEALPRLRLVEDLLPHIDHVLANGSSDGFQEQWLLHAGVPREKILWADGLTHYRCEQLLFCSSLIADCQPGAWLRDSLQALCRTPRHTVSRRWLWISRKDAASRHLTWEDELLAHFPQFEKVTLAGRPPSEQIALFAEASVVAGPHGAGLANLLFAPRGVKLVEFFPNSRIAPLYGRCAQIAGGQAAWAWTDFSHPTDLDRLLPALRDFLGAPAVARE